MNGSDLLTRATPEATFQFQQHFFQSSEWEDYIISTYHLQIQKCNLSFDLLLTPCCPSEVEVPYEEVFTVNAPDQIPVLKIQQFHNILLKHHCGIHHLTLPVEYVTWNLYALSSHLKLYLDVRYSLFHHPLYLQEWFLEGLLFSHHLIVEKRRGRKRRKFFDFLQYFHIFREKASQLGLLPSDPTPLPFLLLKKDSFHFYLHQELFMQK